MPQSHIEDSLHESGLSSTLWVPGIKLWLSGLAAKFLLAEPSHQHTQQHGSFNYLDTVKFHTHLEGTGRNVWRG